MTEFLLMLCSIGLEDQLTVMRLLFCLVLPLLCDSGKGIKCTNGSHIRLSIRSLRFLNFTQIQKSKGDYKMRTPHEFDYDLWTTGEGSNKQYWVRIKRTGTVTEASADVMRLLRSEEKKLRREYAFQMDADSSSEDARHNLRSPLSLDALLSNDDWDESYWLADPTDNESETIAKLLEDQFRDCLTDFQLEVFDNCILGSKSIRAFAREKGLNFKTVIEARGAILKKAKIFF